jgi:hypothetical protein
MKSGQIRKSGADSAQSKNGETSSPRNARRSGITEGKAILNWITVSFSSIFLGVGV